MGILASGVIHKLRLQQYGRVAHEMSTLLSKFGESLGDRGIKEGQKM